MNCSHCRWEKGAHDKRCPKNFINGDVFAYATALNNYNAGYNDGRFTGKKNPFESPDSSYALGFANGVSALEAYINGHDPRFK